MGGPVWVRWLLTASFVALAAYHVHRLGALDRTAAGGRDRAVALAHATMSTGMAVMCSPVGGPLSPASWLTLSGLLAVCSVLWWRQDGDAPHLTLASAAMVYMLAAGAHDAVHMSGPWAVHTYSPGNGLALPVLAFAFTAYFVGYAVWVARRSERVPHLVMSGGMSYALIMMV